MKDAQVLSYGAAVMVAAQFGATLVSPVWVVIVLSMILGVAVTVERGQQRGLKFATQSFVAALTIFTSAVGTTQTGVGIEKAISGASLVPAAHAQGVPTPTPKPIIKPIFEVPNGPDRG